MLAKLSLEATSERIPLLHKESGAFPACDALNQLVEKLQSQNLTQNHSTISMPMCASHLAMFSID